MKSRHEIGEGSGCRLRPPVGPGKSRGRGSSDFSDLECFKSDSKIVLLLKNQRLLSIKSIFSFVKLISDVIFINLHLIKHKLRLANKQGN